METLLIEAFISAKAFELLISIAHVTSFSSPVTNTEALKARRLSGRCEQSCCDKIRRVATSFEIAWRLLLLDRCLTLPTFESGS